MQEPGTDKYADIDALKIDIIESISRYKEIEKLAGNKLPENIVSSKSLRIWFKSFYGGGGMGFKLSFMTNQYSIMSQGRLDLSNTRIN